MNNLIDSFWSAIPRATEFWSAIAGAVVGGLIAFAVQLVTLRASKRQRDEDRLQSRQALGNSLLFKMVRIHSDIYGIHHHLETCFDSASKRGLGGEPWNFVIPLANPPSAIEFSSDEMGMLLAQKDNDLFNAVLSMDVLHNSLVDLIRLINSSRKELTDRLRVDRVDGTVLTGVLRPEERLALQPRIIEVNSLIEQVRIQSKKDCKESGEALDRLAEVLRDKLGLSYKLERISKT